MEQKLTLTQNMRQSLEILQMPLPDLAAYIQDAALSNPLLELEYQGEVPVAARQDETPCGDDSDRSSDPMVSSRTRAEAEGGGDWQNGGSGDFALENISAGNGENFYEMLREQLLNLKNLDQKLVPLCEYIIECLDERGYLHFDLQELAAEQHVPVEQIQQALYVVQGLQPTGVGARTLQECLILQLAQSRSFCEETLHLVRSGLPLLAKRDYRGIAALLGCSRAAAEQAAAAVCALNPIPSQGYFTGSTVNYQIPEAEIKIENGALVLEMNRGFLPVVRLEKGTAALLRASGEKADREYLKNRTTEANQLIQCVENRETTIRRLLTLIVREQQDYFLHGESLRPLTMSQLAQRVGVSNSTVSRALQGKTVLFRGRSLPTRFFFSAAVASGDCVVSAQSVKQRLALFVKAEDPAHPLSDEELCRALAAVQLSVSRRTVAKYREELGIPSSGQRKKR